MLLADDASEPVMIVRWRSGGVLVEHRADRALASPGEAVAIQGTNLLAYAALGGTRLKMGVGHPDGVGLRVGLAKREAGRALFKRIDPGSDVELELRGVAFNQPVRVDGAGVLVHLGYAMSDIEACSLPASAASLFLTADPGETMAGIIEPGFNGRPGAIAGDRSSAVPVDERGVTLRVVIPYGMLRHVLDPWDSELPGTFFEPVRLHAEVEVLPAWAEPLAREAAPD